MFIIMCILVLVVWEMYLKKKNIYFRVLAATVCALAGIYAFLELWNVFPLLSLFGVIMAIIKNCKGGWANLIKSDEERECDEKNKIFSIIVWAGCLEILTYMVVFHNEIKLMGLDYIYGITRGIDDFSKMSRNIIAAIALFILGAAVIYIGLKDYKFYSRFPVNEKDEQYPVVIQRYARKKGKRAALVLQVDKYYEYITQARYLCKENPIGTVFKLPLRYSEKAGEIYSVEDVMYDKRLAVREVIGGIVVVLVGGFIAVSRVFF